MILTLHFGRRGNRLGRTIAVLCVVVLSAIGRPGRCAEPTSVGEMIRRAGNADDDVVRLEILRKLQTAPGLDASLKADVDRMVAEVDRWITSKSMPYFGREVSRTLDYDFGVGPESPLYPLGCLYRGRMLVWLTLESGGIIGDANRRRQFLDKAVEQFRIAGEAFPENRIVGMYLGKPIPWPKGLGGADDAPAWAALQRENLERLAEIVTWWIDHRMQADGQYGGGWGDDCEMWRFWVPVLIAFHDPKIVQAQERFSGALMSQPHMEAGYTSRMSDVEHTAEDSSDVITPMMHLDPDNPLWKRRALRMTELMEGLWTGVNLRGQLQFKSTYFTVDRIDDNPQRACDTVYHPRALQPALLYWQRTGDEKIGRLVSAWMDTWVDAARRAERGKPAGIIPSAIHWPEGNVGGLGENWWDPKNHGEARLYRWPSAMSMMCNTLLLTYHMTGDEKYLGPLRSMAAVRLKWLKSSSREAPAEGSEAWCGSQLGFLAGTLAKYKLLTGSGEFDDLLALDRRAFMVSSDGDRAPLVAALETSADALRINFAGYTSEVRYTDRVLRFPALFGADMMFREAIPSIERPNPGLLYSLATGDPGDCGYFPMAAVRWLTPPRDVAAMVTQTGTRQFSAELFHFGPSKRPMQAELYLLSPGRYTFDLVEEGKHPTGKPAPFSVDGPRTRISFELPPRKLCALKVCPRA
ncbi:MAG: hypothetical protein ACYTG0_14435 [Planctomycetota bacterium]|jgi:hypothetical protein